MGAVTQVIVACNEPEGSTPLWHYEVIQHSHGIVDVTLGDALGATMAVTNEEQGKLWRAEVDARAARLAAGDRELEWLLGTDTGRSSRVLLALLGESAEATRSARVKLNGEGTTPQDPDDLGRCVRLLDRFPAWRSRLGEVAAQHPAWGPMISVWPDLEALYREELPGGKLPATAALMRTLVKLGHGKSEATVDLTALFDPAGGLHPMAMAELCASVDCPQPGLPDRIFAKIPDGTMLFWARDPQEPTVYATIRCAMELAELEEQSGGEDGRSGE